MTLGQPCLFGGQNWLHWYSSNFCPLLISKQVSFAFDSLHGAWGEQKLLFRGKKHFLVPKKTDYLLDVNKTSIDTRNEQKFYPLCICTILGQHTFVPFMTQPLTPRQQKQYGKYPPFVEVIQEWFLTQLYEVIQKMIDNFLKFFPEILESTIV